MASWKSQTKRAGTGSGARSGSGSVNQVYGSKDTDQYQYRNCISRIRNNASLVDIFLNAFNDLFFLCALMGPRHKLLVFTYMTRIMQAYFSRNRSLLMSHPVEGFSFFFPRHRGCIRVMSKRHRYCVN